MKSRQILKKPQIKSQKNYLKKQDNLLSVLKEMPCCQQIIKASRAFRERIYTPLQTILSFVKQVLAEDKSCSKAVIKLAAERSISGTKALSILTGGYVRARQRLSEDTLYQLVRAVGEETSKKASIEWKAFHREVKVCDGTTVDMPDTKANRSLFPPHHNGKKDIGFPLARVVGVMSLNTGSIIDYAIDAFKGKGTGEVSLLRSILDCFKAQDILIADRLYCNFF
jgi:hypothetical protein